MGLKCRKRRPELGEMFPEEATKRSCPYIFNSSKVEKTCKVDECMAWTIVGQEQTDTQPVVRTDGDRKWSDEEPIYKEYGKCNLIHGNIKE